MIQLPHPMCSRERPVSQPSAMSWSPWYPPEGLQADQDAIIEELAGADSEAENDNMNNTAPRGAETEEEEIYPVAPVEGSPIRERMEISPPPHS